MRNLADYRCACCGSEYFELADEIISIIGLDHLDLKCLDCGSEQRIKVYLTSLKLEGAIEGDEPTAEITLCGGGQ